MSADQVDDVEHAEDRLHSVTEALRDLARTVDERFRPRDVPIAVRQMLTRALERLREQAEYCRPTCGTDGAPHEDEDNDCGCPCHERP